MVLLSSYGYSWRSSYWFVTAVVWLGVLTDLLVYSIIVPVIPFQLEDLGYDHISSLTGWLLFAYSGGLAISTLFVAVAAEKYRNRQIPLLVGNIFLIGSQIMFMEAPVYWLMCLARVLQGVGSTMVWVVGMSLICDVTPADKIGQQLGIAMSGLTIGLLLGPPVGGASYTTFGFRAPFIIGIIFATVDLIGRILIIEVKAPPQFQPDTQAAKTTETTDGEDTQLAVSDPEKGPLASARPSMTVEESGEGKVSTEKPVVEPARVSADGTPELSLIGVLAALVRSRRANAVALISLVFGALAAIIDTVISVHLNDVWDLSSDKVGLVMLAAVVPTIFSPPITGWLSDRFGTPWLTFAGIILSIPFHGMLIIEGPLAVFIVGYAFENFFFSGIIAPISSELAAVSRSIDGIGYAHVYGVLNFFFGVGSTVGPIIAGQMYDHIESGWLAICLLNIGLLVTSAAVALLFMSETPAVLQLFGALWRRKTDDDARANV
ncbi:MFS general substrate transporter [Cylindrobasidium torrendii FP15055 ss-10]|uniref:MFS general substrate transporter n=1 Tax=Cylindrobasidium torrendii FP15055 ss-10 TaxID=1314674 RepID=A0A0D7B5H5_9AGAR|nr:MFS general substrate transporter [Cylindrobasidium torrendii FP15055 ss-10]